MLLQIAIGVGLILTTVVVGAFTLYLLEWALRRSHPWLLDEPHGFKLFTVVVLTSLWALIMVGFGVWLWASAFMALDIFASWDRAVYFSLETFTTLGFGDVVVPTEWRIMGGMAAANGLLNFGLITAVMMEGVRDLRLRQARRHRRR